MKEKKTCSRCEREKDLDSFNKSSSHRAGVQPWCRQCKREWFESWSRKNTRHVFRRETA